MENPTAAKDRDVDQVQKMEGRRKRKRGRLGAGRYLYIWTSSQAAARCCLQRLDCHGSLSRVMQLNRRIARFFLSLSGESRPQVARGTPWLCGDLARSWAPAPKTCIPPAFHPTLMQAPNSCHPCATLLRKRNLSKCLFRCSQEFLWFWTPGNSRCTWLPDELGAGSDMDRYFAFLWSPLETFY